MKICFLIPSLSNRGPNVFTLYLVKSLVDFAFVPSENITVYYLKSVNKPLSFPCNVKKLSFLDIFDLFKFDILHSTMFLPDLYLAFLSFFKRGTISGVHNEIRLDTRFLYGKYKGLMVSKIWELALKNIDSLIFSSVNMQNYYLNLGIKTKSCVIPYGVPDSVSELSTYKLLTDHDKLKYLSDSYTVLGTCGLFIERKNLSILIDLLVLDSSLALILIGDGELKSNLVKRAHLKGVIDRVFFTGFVDNSIQYYKYFDIYVSPSYSEGFGLAMLNAISLGLPVCVSNLDIYEGFFTHDNVGIFDPHSLISLKDSVFKVSQNISHYSSCSINLYNEFFSLKVMGSSHYNLYKRLLK